MSLMRRIAALNKTLDDITAAIAALEDLRARQQNRQGAVVSVQELASEWQAFTQAAACIERLTACPVVPSRICVSKSHRRSRRRSR